MSVLIAYDVANNKQKEMKKALQSAGFRDFVLGHEGEPIGLPNTTMVIDNLTTEQVLDKAHKLAASPAVNAKLERVIAVGWTTGSADGAPHS
jgi:hypothetical protein